MGANTELLIMSIMLNGVGDVTDDDLFDALRADHDDKDEEE